jgi:putative spermidine/putrescine transport system ATP-binding protein
MNAGRIEQVASPRDIYDRPATRFVATFVGRSNQMPATRDAAGNPVLGGIAVKGPAAARPAGEIDVFLRPQRIVLRPASDPVSDDLNALPGRVTSVLFVGDRLEIAVETPAGLLLAEMPSTHDAPPVGTAVVAAWRPEDTLFFPQAAP